MQGIHLRKYGVETIINFELYEVDGVDFRTDAVDAGSDCNIRKDQGADATCENDFVDEGIGYSLTLTATEMEAKCITLYIIDSATKVWLDKAIDIETYGNASAQHAFDFDAVNRGTDSAALATALSTAQTDLDTITGASGVVIADGLLTAAKFGADFLTNAKIADNAFAVEQFKDDFLTAAKIATDAFSADALKTDAVTEIVDAVWAKAMVDLAAGAPSATATALVAINYIYESWRNKIEVTSSAISLYKDDASTKLCESDISDDDTTFTKGEYGAA